MIKYSKKMGLLLFSYLPSYFKIVMYCLLGAKIGSGTYLGLGTYILPYHNTFKKVEIGSGTTIGDNVVLSASSICIGDESEIRNNVKITGESDFKLGDFSYIGENSIINLRQSIELGNEVCIGANCSLYTHGVWLSSLDGYPVKVGRIIVRDRTWVSASSFVMPGITIGSNAIVGAGSIVTRDVPDSIVVAGNPAKEIRRMDFAKKLTLDDKNVIIKRILAEFIARFNEKILVLDNSENTSRFQMTIKNRKFFIFPTLDTYLIIYEKNPSLASISEYITSKHDKKIIIILLNSDKSLIHLCKQKGLCWIDFDERKIHLDSSEVSSLLLKLFRNSGIRFVFNKK